MSRHIVLLGDSIFDNQAYTDGQPDVTAHLKRLLTSPWRATLCAVDGAITTRVKEQCRRVPSDASHLILSVGGNDALDHFEMLDKPVGSTAEALSVFHERLVTFERKYVAAVEAALALDRPTTLCAIYNGCFPSGQAELMSVALMMFNDVILRAAFDRGLQLIDLRSVCCDPADYANPIEPSGPGGLKIAKAIARAVGALDSPRQPTRVFVD